jgi:hypothetical protein
MTTIDVEEISNGFLVHHDHLVEVPASERAEAAADLEVDLAEIPTRMPEHTSTYCRAEGDVGELVRALSENFAELFRLTDWRRRHRRVRRRRRIRTSGD